jgi:hypothetical protein
MSEMGRLEADDERTGIGPIEVIGGRPKGRHNDTTRRYVPSCQRCDGWRQTTKEQGKVRLKL